jgi:nitrite reductase/ring-hydroxylating ferredoxin subunit
VPVKSGSVAKALYWDTADPYHYARIYPQTSGKDVLIVGGEDHKTGQGDPDSCFNRLLAWAEQRFPVSGDVAYAWSGQVMNPVDGLAFIGHNPIDERNVYISTGHSGNGMTYGTIAGLLIPDLILGRPNPWAALYDPSRIALRAMPELLLENLNVAVRYGEYLTPAEMQSPKKLARGEGAIVRRGLKKVAVYHDEMGVMHEFSAICPHLSCVVQWNTVEKTWDCPCHGSRFEATGAVVNGPALGGLKPV